MDPGVVRVVGFAVVPDKLDVVEYFFNFGVLFFFEFFGKGG